MRTRENKYMLDASETLVVIIMHYRPTLAENGKKVANNERL